MALSLVYPQLGKEVLNYVGAQQIETPLALPDTIRRLTSAESENAIIRRMTSAELEHQAWQVPAAELKAFIAKSIRGTE